MSNLKTHAPLVSVAVINAVLTGTCVAGEGLTRTWIHTSGPIGGEFTDESRWSDFPDIWEHPGPADTARFNIPAAYIIDFTQDHLTDRVQVRGGSVTFRLAPPGQGGPYEYVLNNPNTLSPSIVVGMETNDTASLNITGGSLRGVFTDVGLESGSFGLLRVLGSGSSLENQWQLRIGNKGSGIFELLNGATVSNHTASIATGQGAFGQAMIAGVGSQWSCASTLTIGKGGYGSMSIHDQGMVISGSAIIAQQDSSFGSVDIAGAGSLWQVIGSLDVGMEGFGELRVRDGASVTNLTFATIGTFPEGFYDEKIQGRATVEGSDSQWTVSGNLYVGLHANGSLTLSRGGRVAVSGDLFRGGSMLGDASQLHIQLGSNADYSQWPALQLGGESQWTGDVHVSLVDSFTPAEGDVFRILSADLGGELTFDLPALPKPLQWKIEADGVNTDLHVIVPILGDLNNDGAVDVSDLLVLLADWGACSKCAADLNDDGSVDVADLLILLANWD